MSVYDKSNHPLRFYPDVYKKIKAQAQDDKVTFQKLGEILFTGYLGNNKEIKKLVKKYADDKYTRKKRLELDDMETEDLLRYIEEQSPLTVLETAIKEEEEEND